MRPSRSVKTSSNAFGQILKSSSCPSSATRGATLRRTGRRTVARALALPWRTISPWPDEMQLSFRITIYKLAKKLKRILVYGSTCAPAPVCPLCPLCRKDERAQTQSSGPIAFRLQGGLPSLDTARSRTDTYTHPLACNHLRHSLEWLFAFRATPGPKLRADWAAPRMWDLMVALKLSPFASLCDNYIQYSWFSM